MFTEVLYSLSASTKISTVQYYLRKGRTVTELIIECFSFKVNPQFVFSEIVSFSFEHLFNFSAVRATSTSVNSKVHEHSRGNKKGDP